jgi:hypothetical protein
MYLKDIVAKGSPLKRSGKERAIQMIDKVVFYETNGETLGKKVEKARTVGCLFVGKDGDVWARGLSITSYRDNFNRKDGHNRAFGRAMKAIINQVDSEPVVLREDEKLNYEFARTALTIGTICTPLFKSAWKPTLSDLEKSYVREVVV